MPTFHDKEFGEVVFRRSSFAKYVRVKVGYDGKVTASLPHRTSLKFVTKLIDQSRDELRVAISKYRAVHQYKQQGMRVGKSHTLDLVRGTTFKNNVSHQVVTVELPYQLNERSIEAQSYINEAIKKVLKKEAQAYLPRRVNYLANAHNFEVKSVHFNNAKTRWGSCSHNGSINLNVALMQLPIELIDYVIVHELCHTVHLNHGLDFWQLVATYIPNYRTLRKEISTYHPYI